ncbi:MAG: hypothetical protein LEGION0403_FIIPPAGN_00183 [Legionella sp.]
MEHRAMNSSTNRNSGLTIAVNLANQGLNDGNHSGLFFYFPNRIGIY